MISFYPDCLFKLILVIQVSSGIHYNNCSKPIRHELLKATLFFKKVTLFRMNIKSL